MTDTATSAVAGTANFAGNCGGNSNGYNSATCPGGMQPNQTASVNGNSPQNCVVANDDAKVFQIDLQRQAGFYSYQIRVEAQGPGGFFGGSMYLGFQDQTGDVYYLSIFSSAREWHEVSYNSSEPAIVRIFWSDDSFTVSDGVVNQAKAKFQVVSPARPS